MVSIKNIAAYISQRYLEEYGVAIDEMKLHKLLYLSQRESIIQTGEPMFTDKFHAWRLGPVMPSIRTMYKSREKCKLPSKKFIDKFKPVFDKVFTEYASKTSLSLSTHTHSEYSWIHAREGYSKYQDSDVPMLTEDIRKDAEYIKKRREWIGFMEENNLMEVWEQLMNRK